MQPTAPGPRRARDAAVVAAVAAVFFAWAMTLRFTTAEPFEDFRFHNVLTTGLLAGDPLAVPHPLFHLLSAGFAILTGLAVPCAGMTVAVLGQASLAAIAFVDLRDAGGDRLETALVALGLALVAPLNVLASSPGESYFGYFFPNILHNPTIALLRPLALALLLACGAVIAGSLAPTPGRTAALAALAFACGLAKPSYLICLLPALALTWLLGGARRDERWKALSLGVAVPGALIAVGQAVFAFSGERMGPGGIAFAPLEVVFLHMRHDVGLVAAKLALSAVFPLAVAACFARHAVRSPAVWLAWLGFLAGASYAYLFAETGPRAVHGNFLWSGQVSLLVLFVASARLLVARAMAGDRRLLVAVCAAALALHVASGLGHAVRFAAEGPWYLRDAPAGAARAEAAR
jgi:hypothetical protein